MEIKVTSTGSSSRMPDRLYINMLIKGTGSTVKDAEDRQSVCLASILTAMGEHQVDFKFLSSPNVSELTKREEVKDKDSKKSEIRFVRDGFAVSQMAEIVVDGWSSARSDSFLSRLIKTCDGNLLSRFELTEAQLSEMSKESMENSYNTAVEYATHLASLEMSRIYTGVTPKLKVKEAKVSATDVGRNSNNKAIRGSSIYSADSANDVCSVKKPLTIFNTVEYIFEVN